MFISFLLLYDIEESLKKDYIQKAEFLYYRLGEYNNLISNKIDPKATSEINSILDKIEIRFATLVLNNKTIPIGTKQTNLAKTVFSLNNVTTNDTLENTISEVTVYHPDIINKANEIRKHILIPIILGVLLFGVFLIWAIRTTVHKPLQNLINATRAVRFGNTNIRLDDTSQDDFGHLQHIPDLQNIQTAGKHLLDLINNILDLSKVEAGKMEIHLEQTDVI